VGPIGAQIASRLETDGIAVTLLDLSPVNLHRFAQAGFATVAGDAREAATLRQAGAEAWELAVVCVPSDEVALEVVRALRAANGAAPVVVRCRLQSYAPKLRRAGATAVVSEEQEAVGPLTRECERLVGLSNL
jgi:CPA2 family monovalent cation:H+ antiporter-2